MTHAAAQPTAQVTPGDGSRTEHDLLGERAVPVRARWGIHTLRATENFAVSGSPVPHSLVRALGQVKKACAEANAELGFLAAEIASPILNACDDLIEGELDDDIRVDALQGGAGTSTNMNVNEVIANRALELAGHPFGRYDIVHPLEHVNLHQSTNDVYPTAVKVAAIHLLRGLSEAAAELQGAFQRKEKAFADIAKLGWTELQPAVPLTLGQEFSAFGEAFSRDRWRTFKCEERLRVVNLGGTAVGTGLTAPRSYIFLVIEKLRAITGLGLCRAENLVDATANSDAFVEVSGSLGALAANLIKVASDLRLLHRDGEIRLPAVQAGSSIMPGKVNPVVLECAMQAGIRIRANDATIAECASRGSLQINEFLPLLAVSLLESLDIGDRACRTLARHVDGIEADKNRCRERLNHSPSIITAFLPEVGYDRATRLLAEFAESGAHHLRDFLAERLGADTVDRVLSPQNLTALGTRDDAEIP